MAAEEVSPVVVFGVIVDDYHDWALRVHMDVTRPIVDYFVIVEMDHTFTNIPRTPRFEEYSKTHENVIWRCVKSPCVKNAYFNSFVQRNELTNVLKELREERRATFVVCINDVDEFIDPSSFPRIREWGRETDEFTVCCVPMHQISGAFARLEFARWVAQATMCVPPTCPIPFAPHVRWQIKRDVLMRVLDRDASTADITPLLECTTPYAPIPGTHGLHLTSLHTACDAVSRKLVSIEHADDGDTSVANMRDWADPSVITNAFTKQRAGHIDQDMFVSRIPPVLAVSLQTHIAPESLARSFVPSRRTRVLVVLVEPIRTHEEEARVVLVADALVAEHGDDLHVILATCERGSMCTCWNHLARKRVYALHGMDAGIVTPSLFLQTTCFVQKWNSAI